MEKILTNRRIHLLILTLLSLGLYINTLQNDFVYDDGDFIVDNLSIRNINNISQFFTSKGTFSHEGNFIIYRPVVTLGFALDYLVWKLNPFGYHLPNILFHILNGLLVYILMEMILGSSLAAFITALFFSIHPVQTEAVAWISGRGNVLSLFFFLLSFYSFVRFRREKRNKYYYMSLILFIAALLCKEMAITLFIMLVIYDIYYRTEEAKKPSGNIKIYVPFIITAILYMLLRYFVLGRQSQTVFWGGSFINTMLTMAKSLVQYIFLFILPVNLNVGPDVVRVATSVLEPGVLISIIILAGLAATAVYSYRRIKGVSFGIVWFLVALIPVSNLIPIDALYAERFMYLPSIGVFMVAGVLISRIKREKAISIIILVFIITYSFLTIRRNFEWKDSITLWTSTLRVFPDSKKALVNRSIAYLRKGQLEKAQARKVFPGNKPKKGFYNVTDIYIKRGNANMEKGFYNRAIDSFNRALEIDPDNSILYNCRGLAYGKKGLNKEAMENFNRAIELNPYNYEAYNNRGFFYRVTKQFDKAVADFNNAIELNSNYSTAYFNRGFTFRDMGSIEKAVVDFAKAVELNNELKKVDGKNKKVDRYFSMAIADLNRVLEIDPDDAKAYVDRGLVYMELGMYDETLKDFDRTIENNPEDAIAYNVRGMVYAMRGLSNLAIANFAKAIELDPNSWEAYNNRGLVYFENSYYSKAITDFIKALEINPDCIEASESMKLATEELSFSAIRNK